MMRVEDFDIEIEDGERELMGPDAPGCIARREVEAGPEKHQDVRRLRDALPAGLEHWHCEGRALALRLEHALDRRVAAAIRLVQAGHVGIVSAAFLQCQTNEFAAALDAWPVVELVVHRAPPQGNSRR